MKKSSFSMKASLIATMILSGQVMAQSLPDEINHPQYLRVYQSLDQLLSQKIAEYEKLAEEKAGIEKTIAQMEKDLIEIPARNNELKKIIQGKNQEIERLSSEIMGIEGILGKIVEDLKKIDSMIVQLQKDLSQESATTESLRQNRNQVMQDIAKIQFRLDKELADENQSVEILNKLSGELNASVQRRQDVDKERMQLGRDVERFKVEIVKARGVLAQNTSVISVKKPLLVAAQARLPVVKAEARVEELKISEMDVTLNPKKAQLNAMKAEMARLSPDITRLEAENKTLAQKVSANQEKIKATNVQGLVTKRSTLEAEISGVRAQIDANNAKMIEIQESIKPTLGKVNELMTQYREASRTRNTAEANRLRGEIDALNATIEPQKRESLRLSQATEKLAISIAPKQQEITNLTSSITAAESQVAALEVEISSLKLKITENEQKIAAQYQANSGLSAQIAALESEVKSLEATREPIARKLAALKAEEAQVSAQATTLASEVQRAEAENVRLNVSIGEMDKTITSFPQESRRLEAHSRNLDEKIAQVRSEIDREQRLLARIRPAREAVQRERDAAQSVLNKIGQDLENSQRISGAIKNKLSEETRNRETLVSYNQDSIRKLDGLKASKTNAEKDIAGATEEIGINEQDLKTIGQELPKLKSSYATMSAKVSSAEIARNIAKKNADDANVQFQNRLSLYQTYLAQAQKLGDEKASVGSVDGAKVGTVDATAKANKLGSESATVEAKWEAIRRGYIRGEIDGFRTGFDIGMASSTDATRGEEDGRLAGAKRAKDQANLVIKPERYIQELERRLRVDESLQKSKFSFVMPQESKVVHGKIFEVSATVPDLSQSEIQEAARIISSLDTMIAQSDYEIKEILSLRQRLADARGVYSAPGVGENANNVNCSAVYKGVKEFVEACKGSYVIRYQGLYNTSHSEAFNRSYGQAFKNQVARVFDAELDRLYPVYYKEATNVGRDVGIATGKKEIYQQSFNRSETMAYNVSYPQEVSRVEVEAVNLVQDYLTQNAALTLKEQAKVSTTSAYGMAPGSDAELKMLVKNIGSQPSFGNSLVKITELSSNLTSDRREAPLTTVAARSQADLSVLKIKVKDDAAPGSKYVIAGEIVHPGNHFRSSRVESFRVESVLNINPSVDSSIEFDASPKVANLFGTKKHDIDVTITPKFRGVDEGFEVVLEEIDSSFAEIISRPAMTEVLGRGTQKKVSFTYKLSKASRGKKVVLKVTVKNAGKAVFEKNLELKPE